MATLAPTSQTIFGSRLLQQMLRRKQDNVFVSPASVELALGVGRPRRPGKTLSALEHVLGVDAEL